MKRNTKKAIRNAIISAILIMVTIVFGVFMHDSTTFLPNMEIQRTILYILDAVICFCGFYMAINVIEYFAKKVYQKIQKYLDAISVYIVLRLKKAYRRIKRR